METVVFNNQSETETAKQPSPTVMICFDDNLAPAACVMLTSLLLNNAHIDFDLYAIVQCEDLNNLNAIKMLCQSHGHTIRFLSLEKEQYSFFKITDHFSHAAFFRIFGPTIINSPRILYLDVDLIVQTDISGLLDLDMGNHIIAGAPDNNPSADFRERLGLSPEDPYINTGVLIIQADIWRKENTTEALLDYYKMHEADLHWADQDLINAYLSGRIGILAQHWNVLYGDIIYGKIAFSGFKPASFRGIFHYNTDEKPWGRRAKKPFRLLYEAYAAKSPIRMPQAARPSVYSRLKKFLQGMM